MKKCEIEKKLKFNNFGAHLVYFPGLKCKVKVEKTSHVVMAYCLTLPISRLLLSIKAQRLKHL